MLCIFALSKHFDNVRYRTDTPADYLDVSCCDLEIGCVLEAWPCEYIKLQVRDDILIGSHYRHCEIDNGVYQSLCKYRCIPSP